MKTSIDKLKTKQILSSITRDGKSIVICDINDIDKKPSILFSLNL
jgi:hypothetical protein